MTRLRIVRCLAVVEALAAIGCTLLIAALICAGGVAVWILGTLAGP